jgi:hypothetical protein
MIPFDRASSSPHPVSVGAATSSVPVEQVELPAATDAPRSTVR